MGRGPRNPGCGCCSSNCLDFADPFDGSGSINADWTATGTVTESNGNAEISSDGDYAILNASDHSEQQIRTWVTWSGTQAWAVYMQWTDADNHIKITVSGVSDQAMRLQVVRRASAVNTTLLDVYTSRNIDWLSGDDFTYFESYATTSQLWVRLNGPIGGGDFLVSLPAGLGSESGFGAVTTDSGTIYWTAYEFGEQGPEL